MARMTRDEFETAVREAIYDNVTADTCGCGCNQTTIEGIGDAVEAIGGAFEAADSGTSRAPIVSDATIAEVAAMEARDRAAGGPPWEVADHPENAQPGGWHHGQITGNPARGW